MRDDLRSRGSLPGQVFDPPVNHARKRRAVLDAAVAITLGTSCAFAISYGPAPLNTTESALNPPVVSAPGGIPAEGFLVAEGFVGSETRDSDSAREKTQGTPAAAAATENSVTQSPSKPKPKASVPPAPTSPVPAPAVPAPIVPPPNVERSATGFSITAHRITADEALALVQAYRVGLGHLPFVGADNCATSTLSGSVHVTPSGTLLLGLAKAALTPGAAQATVSDDGKGPLVISVYSCA